MTATSQTGSEMVHGVMIASVVEIATMTGIEKIVMMTETEGIASMTEAAETMIVEVLIHVVEDVGDSAVASDGTMRTGEMEIALEIGRTGGMKAEKRGVLHRGPS